MPVYHLIFHTLGTWLPDRKEGYYDRKTPRRQPQNMNLARSYRAMMEQDAIQFSPSHQKLLLETCLSLPASYEITVRAVAVVDNHVHLIVSWANGRSLSTIKHLLKSILTDRLNRSEGRINGKWFSRGSGDTKIVDIDHLIELVKSYLPEHGEKVWIEPGILARW